MSTRKLTKLKPRKSLRTILMIWFLVFSVVPLAFVTGYSLIKYEQAINNELVQRLRANVREVSVIVSDYEKFLSGRGSKYTTETPLIYYLSTNSIQQARQHVKQMMRPPVQHLNLFNRDGLLVVSWSRDEGSEPKVNEALESSNLALSEQYKENLQKNGRMYVADAGSGKTLDIIVLTQLVAANGRLAGYVEEIISIGTGDLENLKKRLGIESLLFDTKGQIVAGSHPDFLLYDKDYFSSLILNEDRESLFELTVRDEPFGFIITPVVWGDQKFYFGLGASQQKAKAVIKNVNYAFFTVIGAIFCLMLFTSVITARLILRPLNDLVEGIRAMDQSDEAVEIPIRTETELGLVTESFNEMSRKVRQARAELEKKINELETAYAELKETQAKLVHSGKMASLGQLVAGVAHELNNPIGFIYSNMSHLRDYSNRMTVLIEAADKDPGSLEEKKAEMDYNYIVEDLPRLIQSCEDGARRVRDIVLGLRNFSRLEEAKIKKIDIHEGLDETLQLLAGELKARIKVEKEYGDLPEIVCYPSQLNQVFMNILSNAAQAIDGDGTIRVQTSIFTDEKGPKKVDFVQILIRDTGKGMTPDILEKIFDPFYTTKNVGQGTGLGLSISYGIIKKHGGDIQVRSELNRGTEFVITLPVVSPLAPAESDLSA